MYRRVVVRSGSAPKLRRVRQEASVGPRKQGFGKKTCDYFSKKKLTEGVYTEEKRNINYSQLIISIGYNSGFIFTSYVLSAESAFSERNHKIFVRFLTLSGTISVSVNVQKKIYIYK